jgi:hypothetical protein
MADREMRRLNATALFVSMLKYSHKMRKKQEKNKNMNRED